VFDVYKLSHLDSFCSTLFSSGKSSLQLFDRWTARRQTKHF